jgi:hypothetical protein
LKNFAPTPRGEFPIGFTGEPPLLLENNTPVDVVEFLRQNPPRGKLWNDFVFGSYLTWATLYAPRLAPHVDPRVEMHPLSFWEEYGRIADGAPDASQKLKATGYSDVLLDATEQPGLLRRLHADGWRILWPIREAASLPREGAVLLRRS